MIVCLPPDVEPDPTPDLLRRWEHSGAAERANYQLFLSELCDVLGVPRPDPTVPDDAHNAYVFERAVHFHNGVKTGLLSSANGLAQEWDKLKPLLCSHFGG